LTRICGLDDVAGHFLVSRQNVTLYRDRLERNRRRMQDALDHRSAIIEHMNDGLITTNQYGKVESINPVASTMFGYQPRELIGRNISVLMPSPTRERHDHYIQQSQQGGESPTLCTSREGQGLRKNGEVFPISTSVSRVREHGVPFYIGIVRDLSRQKLDEEEIRKLAYYDPLTGLPNRRLLVDRMHQAIASADRTAQHCALMFIDLDHFKHLNDSLGHEVGDELLHLIGRRIKESVRDCDTTARMGGDEFVVLLESLSIQENVAARESEIVANKLLKAIGTECALRSGIHLITASIGIVVFAAHASSVDDLLSKADIAMYQAKSAGRNTAHFFDSAMQAAVIGYAELERDIRRGISANEFFLHYQVQVNTAGEPIGAEALLRWKHNTRGLLSPLHFIKISEQTGLIRTLGKQVLESACQQIRSWENDGARSGWTVAVNMSPEQFGDDHFVAMVTQVLQASGANPNRLKIELTESMLVADVEATIEKMKRIRATGITFSLDDFGTGYSSLSYLKRMPVAQLKLDQSFVRDVTTDPSDAVIARTVIALGHSLGISVIAEGVETEAQADYLRAIHCDAFQGYLYGHPTSSDRLMALN